MNASKNKNIVLGLLGVLLLLTFLGVSIINYKITQEDVHTQILRKDLPLTMDNIYSELSAELTRPLLISTSMASDTFLKEWAEEGEKDPQKILAYLKEIKEQYGFFTSFFISEKSKKYYRYNEVHKTISTEDDHDQWYYKFIVSGNDYMFEVDSDEASDNSLTIFINHRVLNKEGKLLGVAGVGLNVEKAAELVLKYQKKYMRTVYLSDAKGVIQVHPVRSNIQNHIIDIIGGMADFSKDILDKNSVMKNYEFTRGDDDILLRVRYLQDLKWYLYVEQNDTEALQTARKNFIRTIGIGFLVSTIVVLFMFMVITRYQKKLELLAVYDELTGLANRRFFESEFHRYISNFTRTRHPFSLILMDLDGFKKVNDSMGHLAGDKVLGQVAFLLSKMIRPSDILSRWGGDEFIVLCSGNVKEAAVLAQRIRHAIECERLAGENSSEKDPRNLIRVSCGVTTYVAGETLDQTMTRADKALYVSKSKGGNSVDLGVK